MADKQINIVIGADIEKLKKGFQDAVKITGASGDQINSKLEATAKAIEKDFERIASSANTKRAVTQLQNLALKVQALGPEFQDMADKIIRSAGSIKDSVGDVGAQIDYFASDTRRIDAVISATQGVAGAFGVAEGAAALFGSENEDLQKTMAKVQGAIAVLNGLQAIQNVLQQESAALTGFNVLAQRALAVQAYATASAMNAFKVALATTGIGLAVVGLGLFISKMSEANEKIKKTEEAQRKYNDELTKNTSKAAEQAATLQAYTKIVSDTSKSERERVSAMTKINELGVATSDLNLKNADTLTILNTRVNDYIEALKKKAIAETFSTEIADVAANVSKTKAVGLAIETAALDRLNSALAQNTGITQAQEALTRARANNAKSTAKAEQELTDVIKRQQAAIEDYNKAESKVVSSKDVDKSTKGANSKAEKAAENAKKSALKNQEDILNSTYQLTIDEINAKKSAALELAKTDRERASIEFEAKQSLLNIQEVFLIQQEGLKAKEEQSATDLNNRIASLRAQGVANESEYNTKINEIGQKEIEDRKKANEALQKIADEKQNFVKESNKKELDEIKNYYQNLENTETLNRDKGIISEQEYQNRLLQIRLSGARNTLQALKDGGSKNTAELEAQILALQTLLNNGGQAMTDSTKKFADSINSSLESIATSGFQSIGQALGESIMSGANFMQSAFKIVLDSIASFIEAYGKAAIAYGVAALAVDVALKSMNPVAAIIAGTALVATGAVIRTVAAQGPTAFANGGIVSGPTLGLMGEYPGASTNPEVIAPLDKLKNLISGGGDSGGYVAETRISGRDLSLVLKRYERDAQRG